MFTKAYLDTAAHLLKHYTGNAPFHLYLKSFFAAQKKYGSRDRRQIAQLCYCWFRAGHALKHLDEKAQFTYAVFLCSEEPNALLQQLDADQNAQAGTSLQDKIAFVQEHVKFEPQHLFPWNAELSAEIEVPLFDQSLLLQPHLYLRVRSGKEMVVKSALQKNNIPYQVVAEHCLAVPNGAKVDTVTQLDSDAVVQDINSQRIIGLLEAHEVLKKFTAWDCCAASGGKSLLLYDTFSNVHITVSDVRESILHNLRKRFQKAGIKNYQWFVGNAASDAPPQKYDVILCDVPCSGSGTWSRTPEQLHHFKTEKIAAYAQLQKSIVQNASRYLKPGGLLLYSTCSVFKKENEEVVQFITENTSMGLLKSSYFKGYTDKADTLFGALFHAL